MYKQLFFFSLIFAFCISINAQNLVPNPGFEEYYNCPNKLSQFHNVVNWYTPTIGNPDFYNTCESRKKDPFGVPHNVYGMQRPKEGNGYCGLVLYNAVNNRLIEYIQIELSKQLITGEFYRLSFSVSLADNSKFAISTVEGLLTKHAVSSNFWQPLFEKAQVRYSSANSLKEKNAWVNVSGEFEADGGEKFLSIGNFADKDQSFVENLEEGDKSVAYYYIDNVSLEKIAKPVVQVAEKTTQKAEPVNSKRKNKRKKNRLGIKPKSAKKSKLENNMMAVDPVYFKSSTTELVSASHEELDELVDLLKTYKAMGLVVRANTGLNGSESSNMQLARERADAVVEHLIENKISRNRIKVEYIGSPTPVTSTANSIDNQKNQRIEFLITRLNQ